MKYYLVALFDKDSTSFIEKIEKDVCRKYKLRSGIPGPYIALDILKDPDMEKLSSILLNILKPYKYFKIKIHENLDFNPNLKSINLKVEDKGYIIRLAEKINSELSTHNFSLNKSPEMETLTIPLGITNNNFKWPSSNYYAACTTEKVDDHYITGKINRIELWKVTNNRNKTIVKSFPLREY